MSAKEMFIELGLNNITISYFNEKITRIIYYNDLTEIRMKKEQITCEENGWIRPLDTKYLPAIIQQYNELGWLDEDED